MQKQNKEIEFKCHQCGECCRQAGFVYLKSGEAEKISEALGLNAYEFNARFCDLQGRQRLVLKKNADERCVFLTPEGCSIYLARPQQCRDFPVLWRTQRSEAYCQGLLA